MTPADPIPHDVKALIERLQSHMGKADMGDMLRDCRLAADALASQAALIARAREQALEEAKAALLRELLALSEYDGFARSCGVTSFARTKRIDAIRALIPAEAAKEDRP